MPFITGLRKCEGRHRAIPRIAIELDGAEWEVLDLETVLRKSLSIGSEFNEEQLGELLHFDKTLQATRTAMTHSAFSHKTEKEIIEFLSQHGHPQEVAQSAVLMLKELDIVNDTHVVDRMIKKRSPEHGPLRLKAEMIKRGIEEQQAETAINVACDATSSTQVCMEAAQILIKRLGQPIDANARRRLASALIRRGHEVDDVLLVIGQLCTELGITVDIEE